MRNVLVKYLGFEDKCHRLGTPKTEKQSQIIRFKTQSLWKTKNQLKQETKGKNFASNETHKNSHT